YQNECSVHTACRNVACAAGPQEATKSTSRDTLGASEPASARASGRISNVKRPTVMRSARLYRCVMAISSVERAALFDDVMGAGEERCRNGEAERIRSLLITCRRR